MQLNVPRPQPISPIRRIAEMIYLDYAASTPVDPEVATAMERCLRMPALQANPAATGHAAGREALALIETARAEVAALVGAMPAEVIFTSGATESDNLAIIGAARLRQAHGRHLVTALTEHRAVLECCRYLEANGWRVTWLHPDEHGLVAPAAVAAAIAGDTVLVSLMQVNNETGVIQDIAAVGQLCRERGVLLHVDAAQGAGRVPLDLRAQCIDLLSLSAHKIYGPKGIGALVVNKDSVRRVEPLMHGGGQERGLRPGTLATHQVAGMGVACRLARQRLPDEARHTAALRSRLWQSLSRLPGVLLNGDPVRHSGHILNVSVEGVEGESLLFGLRGLALASGSACASLTGEPSYVLRVLGRPAPLAQSSVRFSFGRPTTAAEIDEAAATFAATLGHLRRLSPVATYGQAAA
jgi:cysteine desulfurase